MMTLVMLCCLQTAQLLSLPSTDKHVTILVIWTGKIKIEKRNELPTSGYLANQEALQKLWKSWRPDEQPPLINFSECLVLVNANRDLNRLAVRFGLSDGGDLNTGEVTTMLEYTKIDSCTYQITLVRREGIKSLKGKPLQP